MSTSIGSLLQILLIDLALSLDNAALIALAVFRIPPAQQKLATVIGVGGAIVFRLLLIFVASSILHVPFLHALGGAYLLYVAVKLMIEDEEATEDAKQGPGTLWAAIATIITADITMSFDNVLALSGASRGDHKLVVLGLLLSMPMIAGGSRLLSVAMVRWPRIVFAAGAVLAFTGGDMVGRETALWNAVDLEPRPLVVAIGSTVLCLLTVVVWLRIGRRRRSTGA